MQRRKRNIADKILGEADTNSVQMTIRQHITESRYNGGMDESEAWSGES